MITRKKGVGLVLVPALLRRSKTTARCLPKRLLLLFVPQKVLRAVWDKFVASAGLLAHGVSRKMAWKPATLATSLCSGG